MTKLPLVSVCTITYNHAKYISKCLDSILMQKTDFEYEMLVGEDDSKDGTRELCINYANKYPEKIRLFLNDRKNVIYINDRPTGRWNFINLIKNATGKYIAICAGDDYWTSADKLQKQVDYLENNARCSICFHDASILRDKQTGPSGKYGPSISKNIFTLEDLLYQNFMQSSSVVFRNKLFEDFPEWYWKVPMGDWPLNILNAQYGDIGYLKETMSCFRIHDKGIWHSRSLASQLIDILDTYEILKLHFQDNAQYLGIIKKLMKATASKIADEYMKNNNREKAIFYYEKAASIEEKKYISDTKKEFSSTFNHSKNFFGPVILNPATLARIAADSSTWQEILLFHATLATDEYVKYLDAFYRECINRFGSNWYYLDILNVLYAAAKTIQPRTYLEIGVRRGRSVCAVARGCPSVDIAAFDMWVQGYAGMDNPGPAFVQSELQKHGHKGKISFINGDSHQTIPNFFKQNPGITFDMITVDGDHTEAGAFDDLKNVIPHLSVGGILVFDDIAHPAHPYLLNVWKKVLLTFPYLASFEFSELGYGVAFAIQKS